MTMTATPFGRPTTARRAFRRLAEARDTPLGTVEEVGHLKRQSLAAHHFVEVVRHPSVRPRPGRVVHLEAHRWRRDLTAKSGALAGRARERYQMRSRSRTATPASARSPRSRPRARLTAPSGRADESRLDVGPVAMAGDQLDRSWLIGCENGVVDLRHGELRAGRPEDMITRSTGIPSTRTRRGPDGSTPRPRSSRRPRSWWPGSAVRGRFLRRAAPRRSSASTQGGGNNGKSVCFAHDRGGPPASTASRSRSRRCWAASAARERPRSDSCGSWRAARLHLGARPGRSPRATRSSASRRSTR